ncbi:MAG: extracellular solute-binding protein [Lachnospiraceae bacterium]|nr:extracellular solute-binding protein [Lachnospiraceae bacterium]
MKKVGKKLITAGLCLAMIMGCTACGKKSEEVVVYTAVDQVYADEIFKMFEQETGIKVQAVYDTESNKTTGLTNRILVEKEKTVCDVFWNNEFIQTIDLEKKGMLQSYVSPEAETIPDYYKPENGTWTAMGGRARVFLVNTDLLSEDEYPSSIYDFSNGKYEGSQLAIAYPMFGTTRTMAAAIYAQLGEEEARRYFQSVADHGVCVVDGNSVTKDMAASGQVAVGFTDTDDAKEAISDGAPVIMVYPDQQEGEMGTLMTPGTVAWIKHSPNPEAAKKFIDFVLSEKVERKLVEMGFFDICCRDDASLSGIKGMNLNLEEIYDYLEVASKDMEEIFSTAQ